MTIPPCPTHTLVLTDLAAILVPAPQPITLLGAATSLRARLITLGFVFLQRETQMIENHLAASHYHQQQQPIAFHCMLKAFSNIITSELVYFILLW